MRIDYGMHVKKDLMVRLLQNQVQILTKVLHHIEHNNPINGFVEENLKSAEKELRWVRKFYFNN